MLAAAVIPTPGVDRHRAAISHRHFSPAMHHDSSIHPRSDFFFFFVAVYTSAVSRRDQNEHLSAVLHDVSEYEEARRRDIETASYPQVFPREARYNRKAKFREVISMRLSLLPLNVGAVRPDVNLWSDSWHRKGIC